MTMMRKLAIMFIFVSMLVILGCQQDTTDSNSQNNTDVSEKVELGEIIENIASKQDVTARLVSYTFEHPATWIRYYLTFEELYPNAPDPDISMIPQNVLDEDKSYVFIIPRFESEFEPRILFTVNNLSMSGLVFSEYLSIVNESAYELAISNQISNDFQAKQAIITYNYTYDEIDYTDYKKFIYSDDGTLLTIVATYSTYLKKEEITEIITVIDSAKLRD